MAAERDGESPVLLVPILEIRYRKTTLVRPGSDDGSVHLRRQFRYE